MAVLVENANSKRAAIFEMIPIEQTRWSPAPALCARGRAINRAKLLMP